MTPKRLLSLDAFRGLTIALMVLVNTPGDHANVYAPLRHADWHGWTITDCVFPSFVWIVGVAITLGRPKGYAEILRRAAILFVLGLVLYAFPTFPIDSFRVLGVLQRIAICYAAAAMIYRVTGLRGQILTILGLLTSYWLIMAYVPAPGFAAGDLSVEGNIAHYIDRILLGAHNYHNTKTWDPEGVISTLPAIATCLLGVVAGQMMKAKQLILTGAALVAAALLLDQFLPINKKLWTSSFTLLMGGFDFMVFGAMLWLIDVKKVIAPFRPAMIMGANAIAVYLLSEYLDTILNMMHWKEPIYQALFVPHFSPINASLAFALAYVLLHFCFAYGLYRKGWFLRV